VIANRYSAEVIKNLLTEKLYAGLGLRQLESAGVAYTQNVD